jgi:transposase InsO family protein
VEFDLRDTVVEFIEHWRGKTGVEYGRLCRWVGINCQRLCDWRKRKGAANRHNGHVPRRDWLSGDERSAIVAFYLEHCEDGYRRCAYMMIDMDIVWAAPSTVYKVLCRAGAIRRSRGKPSRKGKGFDQPLGIHEHWHVDITYIHVARKHCFLTTVIDGRSRYIVVSRLTERMEDTDVGIAVQLAHERFPNARPRVISDNGAQFVGKEFKEFIGLHGFTHVRTSPHYPQSNGKIERWHKSLKVECIRRKSLTGLEQAAGVVEAYVDYYNLARLHSAVGYVTPADMLAGKADGIHAARDEKLRLGRERRGLTLEFNGKDAIQ